ncbi:MAG TPA: DUF1616 domain-containing protein [Dehalococcoidales bacterium]|nr:DUF1616 domain-containing protein [Dehalococcoidales bacterium]
MELNQRVWSRALSLVLVLAVLATAAALIYSAANPAVADRYTEFYVLGRDGRAGNYPATLAAGEEAEVLVGIVNREQENTAYRVEIVASGVEITGTDFIQLENGEKYEQPMRFRLDAPGPSQRVEILLYKQGLGEVYESLYLLVNVEG